MWVVAIPHSVKVMGIHPVRLTDKTTSVPVMNGLCAFQKTLAKGKGGFSAETRPDLSLGAGLPVSGNEKRMGRMTRLGHAPQKNRYKMCRLSSQSVLFHSISQGISGKVE